MTASPLPQADAVPPDAPLPARPRAPLRRAFLGRAGQVLLGLTLGAGIAEAAFHVRDGGAFPHLNVYVPDANLGVRLRPGATQSVAFNGNPRTRVRINRDGFRGADHPAPTPREILVLGDSQVFGLGVEEDETWSAELGRRVPEQHVLNLGVPTYGPLEFGDLLEETLERRAGVAATVLYTINLANDLFEAERPNRDRHVVWDGWAVRAETAPESTFGFPGRALLFRESHAVFALRALLHRGGETVGLASEGSWRDLLGAAATRKPPPGSQLAGLIEEEKRAQRELQGAAQKAYPDLMNSEEGKAYKRSHGNPEDIVVKSRQRRHAEASRPVDVTVTQLIKGAEIRKRIERSLKKRAEAEIEKERARAVLASLRERQEIEKRIAAIEAEVRNAGPALTPLRAPLERALGSCRRRGARLVVVVLPLDVMVSNTEWAKYGRTPEDMSEVRVLVDDLLATAKSLGIPAVDTTAALAAAEPGAFLDGDLHMTPKGHRAVAELVAGSLEPTPAKQSKK